jgi:hypothetical protein
MQKENKYNISIQEVKGYGTIGSTRAKVGTFY